MRPWCSTGASRRGWVTSLNTRCVNEKALEIACLVYQTLLMLHKNQELEKLVWASWHQQLVSRTVFHRSEDSFLQRKYRCWQRRGPWQWRMWRENLSSLGDSVQWLQSGDSSRAALSKPRAKAEPSLCCMALVVWAAVGGTCISLRSTSGLL